MEMTIGLVIVLILAFVIIRFATKILFKILGFLLVVVAVAVVMYYLSIGPFKNDRTDIFKLEDRYCSEDGDVDICECIIEKTMTDMNNRFTEAERLELRENRAKALYAFVRVMEANKEECTKCLEDRGVEEKYGEFLAELAEVAPEHIENLKEKSSEILEQLYEKYEEIKDEKDDVDSKF